MTNLIPVHPSPEVTQQDGNQTNEGKTINNNKDNSRLEQKAQEKSTMKEGYKTYDQIKDGEGRLFGLKNAAGSPFKLYEWDEEDKRYYGIPDRLIMKIDSNDQTVINAKNTIKNEQYRPGE